jgi:hypothetical protein
MKSYSLVIIITLLASACISSKSIDSLALENKPVHTSASEELFDIIVKNDSILFEAYNTCKLEVFEELLSADIEFYHDKGGLTTSKQQLIESLKNNICGKVQRELVKGSIEVYAIPGYGAVQMGKHRFHNVQDKPGTPSPAGKFVHIWQKQDERWKITRVISLH